MDPKFSNNWRNRRNQLNLNSISSFGMQYSIHNYSTDTKKSEMSFPEEMLIHNLHLMPNPLQKNLADTLITQEKPKKPAFTEAFTQPEMEKPPETNYYSSFTGIGSFFSGVFSALSGGMFKTRAKSPAPQYYDCFDRSDEPQPDWQASKREDLNKSARADQSAGNGGAMSGHCRTAAAHCEDKLNRVRLLLTSKPVPTTPKYRRRPRKAFVEPGSVEETFEDAFSPEDFSRLANEPYIECFGSYNHQKEELVETASPKIKTERVLVKETMDIVQTLPEIDNNAGKIEESVNIKNVEEKVNSLAVKPNNVEVKPITVEEPNEDAKQVIVASCEDKVNKLKAFLQYRAPRKSRLDKSADSNSESVIDKPQERLSNRMKCLRIDKPQDKHFKNPCRGTEKRKKSQLLNNIQDDMSFAQEINTDYVSSPESSPVVSTAKLCDVINHSSKKGIEIPLPKPEHTKEYFDEITGRFCSTSTTDSEDSFQIVFSDSPKANRRRKVSDCESEDSFIVFEDSPDSCYTSHDVFGDQSDSEISDGESDSESDVSDSGCGVTCKLTNSMSRTIGDLTDDSLFDETVRASSEDEVDSARTLCDGVQDLDIDVKAEDVKSTGLLMNEAKKLLRRQQPPKKVQFSSKPPKVHVLRVWAFAARQARAGNWEQHALDRDRFKRKIADVDMAVSWVLKPQHRSRVMFQRFMPWWNAQRRLEIAAKKKEAERVKEEERVREEERVKEEARIEEEEIKEPEGKEAEIIATGDELHTVEEEKEIEEVANVKVVDVKVDNVNSDTKVKENVTHAKGVKVLAKCDFYDKSKKTPLKSVNKGNSIVVPTKVKNT